MHFNSWKYFMKKKFSQLINSRTAVENAGLHFFFWTVWLIVSVYPRNIKHLSQFATAAVHNMS